MANAKCSSFECQEKVDKNVNKLSEISDSKTSISACSCGPECGPEKCEGRNRSALVGWDSLRTKIFISLFAAFLLWLLIYVPISLTLLTAKDGS